MRLYHRLSDRLRLWLTLPLLALTVACTRPQVVTTLTDAQWGLAAGCASTWVPAADCQVATDGLTTAIAIAKSAPTSEVKANVIKSVQSTLALLPTGSHAVDYLSYLVTFLG